MQYEVIVIGGGIGGLTAAAVLAARGVSVCLLERNSHVGGCAAKVEHGGFTFDPTHGLFTGWDEGEVYDRLFAELRVSPLRAQTVSPAYVVRLSDGTDIARTSNIEEFESGLHSAFPECADAALDFYRGFIDSKDHKLARANEYLQRCSERFRSFIDVQLQTLAQCSSDECSYAFATDVLDPRRKFWEIDGGIPSLIDLLGQCFVRDGGKLRVNSPVLRLAYGSDGVPTGVDLLNGERLVATRAIISNLTIWDTYGKLIGPARTPRPISAKLKDLHAWGTYQIFLTLDASGMTPLPANRMLLVNDSEPDGVNDPSDAQLVLSLSAPSERHTQPDTAVVTTKIVAEDWFSFHEDLSSFEERDQSMLQHVWLRLHSAVPELGDAAEVIETATPQTIYENFRRRFGLVGTPSDRSSAQSLFETPSPNLWLVGDTVSAGLGIEGVAASSWQLTRQITG